jgi:hypothetical protein
MAGETGGTTHGQSETPAIIAAPQLRVSAEGSQLSGVSAITPWRRLRWDAAQR